MSHKIDTVDQIVKITKIKITIHDRIQTQQNLFLHPVPIQTQGIDTIPIIDHEITHIIDRIITDQMITIKTDHEIIHKIETQVTIIQKLFPVTI